MKSITFILTALLLTPCVALLDQNFAQNKKTATSQEQERLLSLPLDKSNFKYFDLKGFSMDSIAWDKRRYFYNKLDSVSFHEIYQDPSLSYHGKYADEIDQDFFYSVQTSKRGFTELTILSQREGEYCDRIIYFIYDNKGRLLSSFSVAGSCGDGGYYATAYGQFINDSTYLLLSEDNYATENVDGDSITIEHFQQTNTIKSNGTISRNQLLIKTEVKSNR